MSPTADGVVSHCASLDHRSMRCPVPHKSGQSGLGDRWDTAITTPHLAIQLVRSPSPPNLADGPVTLAPKFADQQPAATAYESDDDKVKVDDDEHDGEWYAALRLPDVLQDLAASGSRTYNKPRLDKRPHQGSDEDLRIGSMWQGAYADALLLPSSFPVVSSATPRRRPRVWREPSPEVFTIAEEGGEEDEAVVGPAVAFHHRRHQYQVKHLISRSRESG